MDAHYNKSHCHCHCLCPLYCCPLCCLPYLVSCLLPLLLLWGEAPRCGPSVLAFTVPTNNNQNILALPWQPQRNLGPQDKRSCWPGNCRRRCRRRNYRYLMQICVAYFVVGFFFAQQNLNIENNSKCFLFAWLPFVFCAYVCRNQFFAPFCRRRRLMLIRFEFQHSLCRCAAPALPLTLVLTVTRLFGLIVIIQAEKQICLQSTCT